MPPPNLTAATAIEITSLPYEVTTDPENNTNELWYKRVATTTDAPLLGAHVYGLGGVYKPQIAVSEGPVGSHIDHPDASGFYATEKTIGVPVDATQTYLFRVSGGSGSSYSAGQTFTLRVYNGPRQPVPRGSIVVPDDTAGFPSVILDADTGEVLRFIDLPPGEFADTLDSGHILTEDVDNPSDLKLFDGRLNLVATLAGFASGTMRIRTNSVDKFYTSNGTTLRAIDTAGTTLDTWTLAATPIMIAPAQDDSILYYASSGTNAVVRRWDLVGDTALSNLASGVVSYFIGRGGFVLADGSILVHYFKTSGGVDHFIRRYDPSGSIVQTYSFGTTDVNQISRSA